MANPRGKIVTVKEFAEEIGVNTHTVRLYLENGLPVFEQGGKGVPHKLDMFDAWKWAIQRKTEGRGGRHKEQLDENDPKQRANTARADALEFELAHKRGEYILIREVTAILSDELIETRSIFAQVELNACEEHGSDFAKWIATQHAAAFERIVTAKQPLTLAQVEEFRNERTR